VPAVADPVRGGNVTEIVFVLALARLTVKVKAVARSGLCLGDIVDGDRPSSFFITADSLAVADWSHRGAAQVHEEGFVRLAGRITGDRTVTSG